VLPLVAGESEAGGVVDDGVAGFAAAGWLVGSVEGRVEAGLAGFEGLEGLASFLASCSNSSVRGFTIGRPSAGSVEGVVPGWLAGSAVLRLPVVAGGAIEPGVEAAAADGEVVRLSDAVAG